MAKKARVVLYTDPECPACKSFKPIMKKLAAQNNISVKEVNVLKCPKEDKFCPTIKLVPTLAYEGSEIPFERIPERLRELSRRKK